MLNSSDATFRELRDMSFEAVGPRLGQRMKALQSDYKDSKVGDPSPWQAVGSMAPQRAQPGMAYEGPPELYRRHCSLRLPHAEATLMTKENGRPAGCGATAA